MSSSFFRFPRCLSRHPAYIKASAPHRIVLTTFLDYMCFAPTDFSAHGSIIKLLPGQFGTTERAFAKLCGGDITRTHVERGLDYFEERQILRHEVRQKKTIITLIHRETYEILFNEMRQDLRQDLRQTCAIKEETKELIQRKTTTTSAAVVFFKNSDFSDDEWKSIHLIPGITNERIKLGLEFVNHPKTKIKTTRIATMIWHCQEINPPLPPQEQLSPQQKLAFSFMTKLTSMGLPEWEEKNKKLISENRMFIWLNGETQISLKNPVEEIKKDFDLSLKELIYVRK